MVTVCVCVCVGKVRVRADGDDISCLKEPDVLTFIQELEPNDINQGIIW